MRHRVTYLGFEISGGQRELGTERKEPVCRTPEPATAKGLWTFLERTGWCRLWIYHYGLLVKSLYELLKENTSKVNRMGEARRAFSQLKNELMRAPALGLQDVIKPFCLYSHERQNIALGVPAQQLRPHK